MKHRYQAKLALTTSLQAGGSSCALATALLALALSPGNAAACGGLFCGQSPVDQNAERIVFSVRHTHTDMVVQINYSGRSEDFSWVLPLVETPSVDALGTFPEDALDFLERRTNPRFRAEIPCPSDEDDRSFSASGSASESMSASADDAAQIPTVAVELATHVGPYEVTVISSTDPAALVPWLVENHYNVVPSMVPVIEHYGSRGLKLLAMKLSTDAEVSDITPFKLRLPGRSPSIPLQLTALAVQPPMDLQVYVLADTAYLPAAPWRVHDIPESELMWRSGTRTGTNWRALVAEAIVKDGPGFVVERAEALGGLMDAVDDNLNAAVRRRTEFENALLRASAAANAEEGTRGNAEAIDPAELAERRAAQRASLAEDIATWKAMRQLMQWQSHVTRLFARLPGKQMWEDPIFKATAQELDAPNPRIVPGYAARCARRDRCDGLYFGEASLCAKSEAGLAAAACAPGSTARLSASGRVSCEDLRMSFLNPGEAPLGEGPRFADPCAGYDCGAGRCVAQNLTPSCVCDMDHVAIAGTAGPICVAAEHNIPLRFYTRRLSDLRLASVGRDMPSFALEGMPTEDDITEESAEVLCRSSNRSPAPAMLLFVLLVDALRRRARKAS